MTGRSSGVLARQLEGVLEGGGANGESNDAINGCCIACSGEGRFAGSQTKHIFIKRNSSSCTADDGRLSSSRSEDVEKPFHFWVSLCILPLSSKYRQEYLPAEIMD